MNYFKHFLKSIGIFFSILLISILLMTVLSYFNILSPTVCGVLEILFLISSLFISSYYLGKFATSKGYLEGVKFSAFFISFSVILSMLFKIAFNSKRYIYYGIVILSCLLGSIFGINKKKED